MLFMPEQERGRAMIESGDAVISRLFCSGRWEGDSEVGSKSGPGAVTEDAVNLQDGSGLAKPELTERLTSEAKKKHKAYRLLTNSLCENPKAARAGLCAAIVFMVLIFGIFAEVTFAFFTKYIPTGESHGFGVRMDGHQGLRTALPLFALPLIVTPVLPWAQLALVMLVMLLGVHMPEASNCLSSDELYSLTTACRIARPRHRVASTVLSGVLDPSPRRWAGRSFCQACSPRSADRLIGFALAVSCLARVSATRPSPPPMPPSPPALPPAAPGKGVAGCMATHSFPTGGLQKPANGYFQRSSWTLGCYYAEYNSGGSLATCQELCSAGCCTRPGRYTSCKSNSCSGGGCCQASENICKLACSTGYFLPPPSPPPSPPPPAPQTPPPLLPVLPLMQCSAPLTAGHWYQPADGTQKVAELGPVGHGVADCPQWCSAAATWTEGSCAVRAAVLASYVFRCGFDAAQTRCALFYGWDLDALLRTDAPLTLHASSVDCAVTRPEDVEPCEEDPELVHAHARTHACVHVCVWVQEPRAHCARKRLAACVLAGSLSMFIPLLAAGVRGIGHGLARSPGRLQSILW